MTIKNLYLTIARAMGLVLLLTAILMATKITTL